MNNFTKEELQETLSLLERGFGSEILSYPIAIKIQANIDNYCEHDGEIDLQHKHQWDEYSDYVECKTCKIRGYYE